MALWGETWGKAHRFLNMTANYKGLSFPWGKNNFWVEITLPRTISDSFVMFV